MILTFSPCIHRCPGNPVLGVEDVPYANDKIGPGVPPIRTALRVPLGDCASRPFRGLKKAG
jgi:hypothetical protein